MQNQPNLKHQNQNKKKIFILLIKLSQLCNLNIDVVVIGRKRHLQIHMVRDLSKKNE